MIRFLGLLISPSPLPPPIKGGDKKGYALPLAKSNYFHNTSPLMGEDKGGGENQTKASFNG